MRVNPLLGRFGYGVAKIVLPAEPYRAPKRPLSLSRGLVAAGGELLREGRLVRQLLWDCSLATFLVVVLGSLVWTSLRDPDEDGVLIVAFETPAGPLPGAGISRRSVDATRRKRGALSRLVHPYRER